MVVCGALRGGGRGWGHLPQHNAQKNYPHALPHKGHEALGMLLVLWVLIREELEHNLLLLVHTPCEGDGGEDEDADAEDAGHERGAKRRKHEARVDGMAHVGVWACRHELVMLFHRWARAPITAEIHARPNGKADTDYIKRGADPAERWRWREDAMREERCSYCSW